MSLNRISKNGFEDKMEILEENSMVKRVLKSFGLPAAFVVMAATFMMLFNGSGAAAPKCTVCGTVVLPPQPFCFECQSQAFEWIDLPGTGTIYTYTVVRHPLAPQLAEVVRYVSGVVELDGTQGAGARL